MAPPSSELATDEPAQRAVSRDRGAPADPAGRLADIPVALIDIRADQPRQGMGQRPLKELTDSVRMHGILQPIRVRPKGERYEIIAGARRWTAAREAGLRTIPAVIVDVGDGDAHLEALIENIQREDLNPVDRAQALMQLRVSLGIPTWEEVGNLIGIRRAHVYRLLRLDKLPKEVREDIRVGRLTEKHGRALLTLHAHPDRQLALWDRIHAEHLSGDEAVTLATSLRQGASGTDPAVSQANSEHDAAPGSPAAITASGSGGDGRVLQVLHRGEPVLDGPTAAPAPASSATCRRELSRAIERVSRALAAAMPADCMAMRVELITLGEAVQSALQDCQAPRRVG
jgi:ParB family transcriptional regulator, chromosome partitioning protein